MNFKIEQMTLNDFKSIKDILQTEFDNFWTSNVLKDELNAENSYVVVAKDEKSDIVGFADLKIIIDEADIMNIVVRKTF